MIFSAHLVAVKCEVFTTTSTRELAKSKNVFRILTREDAEDEPLFSYLSFIRPTSFISLSHSDNQSESTTKFYNSSKADVQEKRADTDFARAERSDRTESFWMSTDLVKFPVHSLRLLRKKLRHLAGCCYFFYFF